MDILILDQSFKSIAVLETFESLIWTDRYNKYGDFEIYTSSTTDNLSILQPDYYLWTKESEHVMIVEDRGIDTDVEEGKHLTVIGRSLESIIGRRIVWKQTILTGSFQNGIKLLLDENIISPIDSNRRINNFIFEFSTDPSILALTIDAQFTGDNLYDAIKSLCESNGVGFKVTLNDNNQFVFKLYSGKNRSYDQITNPYVVFSPNFENLVSSNYMESNKTLKTITLVAGEGEGTNRRTVTVSSSPATGINRREMYTDARDISSSVDGRTLTQEEYNAQLTERGLEKLAENVIIKSFEGQVEPDYMFKYGEDFFMGDIVQIANEYGMESKSRVVELVRSQNKSGIDIYPTFSNVE